MIIEGESLKAWSFDDVRSDGAVTMLFGDDKPRRVYDAMSAGNAMIDAYLVIDSDGVVVKNRNGPHGIVVIGADALAKDGWVWRGWTFSRDGVRLNRTRLASGRYADRLPTNRQRKRQAAKARRRLRMAA
mgnify:CR=1 FL=1|jgi:hypothetical protein